MRIANEILMFFRAGKKSAQDVSINEPIDTDKDGNALTLMDTMAVDDTVIDDIDVRMKSEKLYDYLPALEPRASPGPISPALRKRPWKSCGPGFRNRRNRETAKRPQAMGLCFFAVSLYFANFL